jgi:translation initiation factor IF-2
VSLKTPTATAPAAAAGKAIEISRPMTVGDLAAHLGISPADVQRDLMKLGILANLNAEVSVENAMKVAQGRGFQVTGGNGAAAAPATGTATAPARPAKKGRATGPRPRPPIVVIMGHVDHGKTTLLDAIRNTHVTEQEFGGITQHIGAYQVAVPTGEEKDGKKVIKRITFLDTPGHEAFTAMRARGARGADIAIIVVAADDGVMPQTVEAINHAKAADVQIIVAVNKVDKEDANLQRVLEEMAAQDIVPAAWGGQYDFVEVSALERLGIDELLEHILFTAEVAELTADPNAPAEGTIIEAKLDPGKGPVATVLVEQGTLEVGDAVVAGSAAGKVRAMMDDRARPVREAGPATPVEVLGLSSTPMAGDRLQVVESERAARQLVQEREQENREAKLRATGRGVTLEALYRQIREGEVKDLNVIIKADVQGSVEAVRQALEKLQNEEVHVHVLHAAVGNVGENDILLASVEKAIVLGFNVKADPQAKRAAADEGVEIKHYKIIYDLIEDVQAAMEGMLKPVYREVILGHATVRATFKLPRGGVVAGCYVNDGRVVRGAEARVHRGKQLIHTGEVDSLKHIKEDVREMAAGFECGILMDDFNDFQEGDVIEVFQMEQVSRR